MVHPVSLLYEILSLTGNGSERDDSGHPPSSLSVSQLPKCLPPSVLRRSMELAVGRSTTANISPISPLPAPLIVGYSPGSTLFESGVTKDRHQISELQGCVPYLQHNTFSANAKIPFDGASDDTGNPD
jgi:hypothetical protein